MPRPRTTTDAKILEAALALMTREGPDALTLAAVGKEVGLSAATLIQRFATKEGLLRAALERAWDTLDAATAKADADAKLTFDGALAILRWLGPTADDGPEFTSGLLLLREDLRDPVLRQRGASWLETLAIALGRRLTTDARARRKVGRLMVRQWQGTQIWWAFTREGAPGEAIERGLREWYAALKR